MSLIIVLDHKNYYQGQFPNVDNSNAQYCKYLNYKNKLPKQKNNTRLRYKIKK